MKTRHGTVVLAAIWTLLGSLSATKEPVGITGFVGKSPDGLTPVTWFAGKPLAWDVTAFSTLADSYVDSAAREDGAPAEQAALRKIKILMSTAQELVLKPFDISHTKPLGGSILFTCEVNNADDEVDYKIKWIGIDGREVTDTTGRTYVEEDSKSTKKLYLTSIQSTDAGQYTCSATIGDQPIQKTTKLQIFREIGFGNVSTVQYLQSHTNALIRCDVSGQPKPEVSWRYAGKRLTFGGATSRYELKPNGLVIKNVTTADNGEYTCRAEVDVDGRYDERKIRIEVHIPPKISEGPGTIEGVEGRQATLECKVSDEGLPKPKYEFFKDDSDKALESSATVKVDTANGRVQFESLTKSDEGKYTCTASNDVGKDSASGSLKVLVKPLIYELNNATENEEKSAILTCKSFGDPRPTMTFSKQGNESYPSGESADGRIIVSDKVGGQLTLTIKNLSPEDSANYVCQSNSSLGFHEMTTSILVKYRPTLGAVKPGCYGCGTISGFSIPYTILHPWLPWLPCIRSLFGAIDANQPRFAVDHQRVVHGWAASSHNITCSASGQPSPRIEWLLRDQLLENNETFRVYDAGSTSHLLVRIRPVDQPWIYANYTCRAVNDLGRRNLLIELKRATVPGQPRAVNITKQSPTMLIISVEAPEENGGVDLTGYRVEYKEILVTEFAIGGKVSLENLEPNTSYTMVVRAKNDVGVGLGLNVTARTAPIREPSSISISSAVQAPRAHRYLITWENPDTGGKPITDYMFRIRPVKVSTLNGTEVVEPLKEWSKINRPDNIKSPMTEYELENLEESTSYEVEIKALNNIGWSPVSERFIFTTSKEKAEELPSVSASSSVSVGLVLAITFVLLIVLLLIFDLSCYFVNNCGLTSLICTKICGRTTPLSKEKTAEEGESKEALTEKQSPAKEPIDGAEQPADAPVEKVKTEGADTVADDHDEKPLLIDSNSDVKKDDTTDENKPSADDVDIDDEPVKTKIEDDEITASDDKEEIEQNPEQPAAAEDAVVTGAETVQPAEG